ncbi:MAG: hypothetical protein L0Y67_03930 [Gammaproteobacteria bacterium]|nr:hypothetical protein [Gammaproteobacteria bacterium]MCI0590744.1 hypothetical protein [Gammaproteobacteria bacterium]
MIIVKTCPLRCYDHSDVLEDGVGARRIVPVELGGLGDVEKRLDCQRRFDAHILEGLLQRLDGCRIELRPWKQLEELAEHARKSPASTSLYVTSLIRHRIVGRHRHRWVVPLVLIAFLSNALNVLDIRGMRPAGEALLGFSAVPVALVVAGVLAIVGRIYVILFYVLAWIARITGRIVNGHGVANLQTAGRACFEENGP